MYQVLWKTFGKPDLDLVTWLNTKCFRYVLYKLDPYAYKVDEFWINWSKFKAYVLPPFSTTGKVLANMVQRQDEAIGVVLCWQTQPSFPQIVRLIKRG